MNKSYTGTISISGRGTGYFNIEDKEDPYIIEEPDLDTAMNRDEVEITVISESDLKAKVIKVIERSTTKFVGTVETEGGHAFLVPDNKRMYRDILLEQPLPEGATKGIKVLAELVSWDDHAKDPVGKITQVIGKKGVHEVEMQSIILGKGIEESFQPELEKEADVIVKAEKARMEDEIKDRRDMRGTTTMTVDPISAKDFDDALSFKKLDDGNFEVGVHIADVSHYVRPGSLLDKEANKRSFSTYLVDRTIPMLPEILSNDVCSLMPNVDRLAFSAIFVLNAKGEVQDKWFGKSVIHSDKRFSYEDAQKAIDTKSGDYSDELVTLNTIAKEMQKAARVKGAIDFAMNEYEFELDDAGKPIRIYKKAPLETHKMIEQFMLLANREVAGYIAEIHKKNKVKGELIYRTHDSPDQDKFENLMIFLRAMGHDVNLDSANIHSKDINNILDSIKDSPQKNLIQTAVLRTMSKAIYTTNPVGHFGLALPHYTHFTSPIRRYMDLLVHRVLFDHLSGKKVDPQMGKTLEAAARNASERELKSVEAERDSIKYKQVEFMKEHIGKTFKATVTGVMGFGLFVQDSETGAEGLIKVRDLPGDYYNLDEKNYAMVGERTKRKFSLGDELDVKLTSADLDNKSLDFVLV